MRAFLVLFGLLLMFIGVLAPISRNEYKKRLKLWLAVIGIGLILVVLSIVYPSLMPKTEETPEPSGIENGIIYNRFIVSELHSLGDFEHSLD
jgi:uncharacterized membrane protein